MNDDSISSSTLDHPFLLPKQCIQQTTKKMSSKESVTKISGGKSPSRVSVKSVKLGSLPCRSSSRNASQHNLNNNDSSSINEYLSVKRLYLSRAKLKQSSQISALLSGFALVAMVELDIPNTPGQTIPLPLLLIFTLVTTLLVSVHMLALMISTCILPHIDAVASASDRASQVANFGPEKRCKLNDNDLDLEGPIPCSDQFANHFDVSESPHDKMRHYTSIAWAFSTVIGIFLFLIELAILVWVKFWALGHFWVPIASTLVLIPVIAAFLFFAFHFYRQLVAYKFERSERGLRELEEMVGQINSEDELGGR